MTRPVVAVLDDFADVEVVAGLVPGYEVRGCDTVPRGPGIVALIAGAESPVCVADLDALPDLQVLAVTSSGYDHVPVAAAAERGLWVTSAAGYCTDEVAESALALGLGLLRGVVGHDRAVRRGQWDVTAVASRRIAGTRWGLVGGGRIARALATLLEPLGVEVSAWDPRGARPELPHGELPHGELPHPGLRDVPTLAELLAGSDIVSVHLPLVAERVGLIGAAELALMPRGSFLVNVARGELVDPAALRAALADGRLAGAALDVFAVEPLPVDDPLRDAPNLVLNPHAAWYSPDAGERAIRWATQGVADVLAGRRPERVVAEPRAGVRL